MATQSENSVAAALVRLNAHVLGGVIGVTSGAVLFFATLILLLQGGENTGQMLVLLAHFFPGYGMSIGGAVAGGLWVTLMGYAVGFIVGRAYGPWFLRGAARMIDCQEDGSDIVGAHTIVGLRPTPFATVTGALLAVGLFCATNWLFFRYEGMGSPNLELLANFMPGFESNPVGSLFGAFWIFLYGFGAAFGTAWIYGKVSTARNH